MPLSYSTFHVGPAQIAFCPLPHVQSICAGLWFPVGGRYETASQNGTSHFIEHMLFKGTKKRTAKMISEQIEGRGGDLNAFTSSENTCYYARMGSQHLPLLLEVLLDMVHHPLFNSQDIEKERTVIQEEIRMYDDQPSSVVSDMLQAILWPNHPLGRPVTGTLQTVSNLKRADLMQFWKTYYHDGRLLITIAGNAEQKNLSGLIQKHLCPLRKAKTVRATPAHFEKRRSTQVTALSRSVQQANLALGIHSFSCHDPRRYALRLLSAVLGENMSSRLFQILREKHGWVYSVSSASHCFSDAGTLYISMGLEQDNVPRALKIVAGELQRLQIKTVSRQELARAKDYVIGQLQLELESPMNQVSWMGSSMLNYGRIRNPQDSIDAFGQVTPAQMQSVANDIFQPGRLCIACVGPDAQKSLLEEAALPFSRLS